MLRAMSAHEQAGLAGFDLSLIDESLRSSPEQRVLQHQQALTLVLELEKVGKELRERAESSPAATDRS
jgi:hypothetical protein